MKSNTKRALWIFITLLKHLSILNTFIFEIRGKSIQKDRMRFRRNIECIGKILSYELNKSLNIILNNKSYIISGLW